MDYSVEDSDELAGDGDLRPKSGWRVQPISLTFLVGYERCIVTGANSRAGEFGFMRGLAG